MAATREATPGRESGGGFVSNVLPSSCGYTVVQHIKENSDATIADVVRDDGQHRIVKVLGNGRKYGPFNPNEIYIHSTFVHTNITPIERIIGTQKCDIKGIGIVMEKGENTLINIKVRDVGFDRMMDYIVQCLYSLDFLHSQGYMHLDVKYENFIIKNGICKLIDFGFSHKSNDVYGKGSVIHSSFPMTTFIYCPPELYDSINPAYDPVVGARYTGKIDVWYMGYVIVGMLCGTILHTIKRTTLNYRTLIGNFLNHYIRNEANKNKLLSDIVNRNGTPIPPEYRARMISLLSRVLNYDPSQRPTIEEIIRDPFFESHRQRNIPTVSQVVTVPTSMIIDSSITEYNLKMLDYVVDRHDNVSIEVLFLAIDLNYRVYHTFDPARIPPEVISTVRKIMAAVCIWMALKMANGYNASHMDALQVWCGATDKYFARMEEDIVITLKGDIRRKYVYDMAQNMNQVGLIFDYYLFNSEVYLNINMAELGARLARVSNRSQINTPFSIAVFNENENLWKNG